MPNQLNMSQERAVNTTDGPMLVIACAGSGKTKVLIERVIKLLQKGVQGERILLLTFTRRAAKEMLERAANSHVDAHRVDGGTFHAFAMRMISQYYQELKLPRRPTVIDTDDAENAIASVAESLDLNLKEQRLPSKAALQSLFSYATNRGISTEQAVSTLYPQFIHHAERIHTLRQAYAKYKLKNAYVDFDDLLILLNLLLKNPSTQIRIQKRYDYVLIDEYQDTNQLQGHITQGLAGLHQNVMVVGDDAQSIYAFRGADHGNILAFPQRFPTCQLITLEDNYRSTQAILDLANTVLGTMIQKYDKSMRATHLSQGAKPKLHIFEDSASEADYIADQIKEGLEAGRDLSELAVLFRNNMLSFQLEAALTRRQIAYVKYGGLKITEMAHVKDVLASLRILHNPLDELAWLRALQLLEGIGASTASKLFRAFSAAEAEGLPLMGLDTDPMIRAQDTVQSLPSSSRYKEPLSGYLEILLIAAKQQTPLAMYTRVVEHYQDICLSKFDNPESRLDDLEFFKTIIGRYRSLESLLADLTLDPVDSKGEARANPEKLDHEPVTLSTIHSAKGLEWEEVYLLGLQDGILPSFRAINAITPDDQDALEEEKRLLYVAITRAKRLLNMSFAITGHNRSSSILHDLSRFLQDNAVASAYERVTHSRKDALSVEDILEALSGGFDNH